MGWLGGLGDKKKEKMKGWLEIQPAQLTNYSINTSSSSHLRNWSVEVSADGNEWLEVDCHIDDQELSTNYAIATFATKK